MLLKSICLAFFILFFVRLQLLTKCTASLQISILKILFSVIYELITWSLNSRYGARLSTFISGLTLNLIIVKSNLSQNEKEMWSSWVLAKQKWYLKYFSFNLKLFKYISLFICSAKFFSRCTSWCNKRFISFEILLPISLNYCC